MPLTDWIQKYPYVRALLQADDEILDYTPDAPAEAAPDGAGGQARQVAAWRATRVAREAARLAQDGRDPDQAGLGGPPGLPLARRDACPCWWCSPEGAATPAPLQAARRARVRGRILHPRQDVSAGS